MVSEVSKIFFKVLIKFKDYLSYFNAYLNESENTFRLGQAFF